MTRQRGGSGVPRRGFLRAAGAAVLTAGLARKTSAVSGAGDARRNLVVILVDDLRYDGMGCRNPYFTTPRLDPVGAEGCLFEAGALDQFIRRHADADTRRLFDELSRLLEALLKEYGLAPEPNWLPAGTVT